MADYDLFLSYASIDLEAARSLEDWFQSPPQNRNVWRDRRDITPGTPDYYSAILSGISASANFVVLLSPAWLRSKVAAKELNDACIAGKKVIFVVHPDIVREPKSFDGRGRKAELFRALQTADVSSQVERSDWIWLNDDESEVLHHARLERAIATDFRWAERHAVIEQRYRRWLQQDQVPAVLLRGAELAEVLADAFADVPGRQPILTEEQRNFLLESQRHEAAERERVEGLYWGAQARGSAYAARECAEVEPDTALLLAAQGATVAAVTETRAILLSLIDRYAALTGLYKSHGDYRWVSGVALSLDGCWLASVDRPRAIGDDRPAHLVVQDTETGREHCRVPIETLFSSVAWGERWLATASPGNIGWLRWDEWKERFRGNTPTQLTGAVTPDYLAFSPPGTDLPYGEMLAWGTQFGDYGLIRVGDHVQWQGQLSDDRSSDSLTGLAWLRNGKLLTAEKGRIRARGLSDLDSPHDIVELDRVYSLSSDGERWVAACERDGQRGLMLGRGLEFERFILTGQYGELGAVWAGPAQDQCLLVSSGSRREGAAAVALWHTEHGHNTLLKGDEELCRAIAADPTGLFVAAGDTSGRTWLWDRTRRSHLVAKALPNIRIRCIAASTNGQIALVTEHNNVRIHEHTLMTEPLCDVSLDFAPVRLLYFDSGQALLALGDNSELGLINMAGDVQPLRWPVQLESPLQCAAAADARMIAALCPQNKIALLQIEETEIKLAHMIDAGGMVLGLAIDPTSQRVCAAVERLGVDLLSWSGASPESKPTELSVSKCMFPPVPIAFIGSETLVAGDGDDLLFLPVMNSDEMLHQSGHNEPVKHVAATHDIVVSTACNFDDTRVDEVRIWTADGQPLGPIVLPDTTVDLVLHPNGDSAFALGNSGQLWQVTLQTEDWIAAARRVAGRELTKEEERRFGIDAWRSPV